MRPIRTILVSAAAVAAVITTSPTVAEGAPAPRPTATLTSCTLDPAGSNLAEVTIRNARAGHGVRWTALWIHYGADPYATTTSSHGLANDGRRVVLRFRFGSEDGLKLVAKRGDRTLLSTWVDTAAGCGSTTSSN